MISYNFPIWKGALDNAPENVTPHNFSIDQNSNGLIQQTKENKIIKNIVEGYSLDEYNFITSPPGFSDWATKIGEQYKYYINEHVKSFKNLDILEVGGGSDFFGIEAVNNGANSYTIIDPAMDKSDSKKIRIIKDYFGEQTTFNKQFDLILSLNTIEHVPTPFDFMLGISKNLKSNGICILIYPDIKNQFLKGDFNALIHEHFNYFTLESSRMLFEKTGFKITNHFSSEDTFYFCLQNFKTTTNETNCNQTELLDKTKIALDNNLKYFVERVKYATQKGKVGLHGCCAGLNNLIYLSSINDDRNIYLFDGDISKKGKYISSSKKNIKHTNHPEYSNMDFIFVAAMTFYDDIKRFAVQNSGIDENHILPIYPF